MKTNKRKGYVLVLVLVVGLIMATTAVSTITIIFRYMIHAKENIGDIETNGIYQTFPEEVYPDARI